MVGSEGGGLPLREVDVRFIAIADSTRNVLNERYRRVSCRIGAFWNRPIGEVNGHCVRSS